MPTSTLELKQISVLGGQWDCVHSDRLLNKGLEISQMAGLGRRSSGFSEEVAIFRQDRKAWLFCGGART